MVTLTEGGAWLINGRDIIPDNEDALSKVQAAAGRQITREEAAENTIAYGILKEHNTSDTMDKLKAKKKYYVRIRTYKTVSGQKYYSAWSKVKAIKTK